MLVGRSRVMVELVQLINQIGRTAFTVLIEGESGVGKEEVAKEIHRVSARRRGPFVAVNCAALVETLLEAELFGIEERTATGVRGRQGKFEQADGGTLFLDEVGDLSLTAQAKLLRVLQDMTVQRVGSHLSRVCDTRVVAATNRGLLEMVAAGRFRADLYYRLAGVEVLVPPLRERREDVPLLVDHFLALSATGVPITVGRQTMAALVGYDWPGNVRQLARVLERAIAVSAGPEMMLADLPASVRREAAERPAPVVFTPDLTLRAWSSQYVRTVLTRCRGNKRLACDVLDISFHTLKSYLAYGEPAGAHDAAGAVDAERPRTLARFPAARVAP
jgi:transcriptional regulator with PAS, ATPase and Fis domain